MLHEEDESPLHERIKLAEKQVQRATDDLSDARTYYTSDPTDRNRDKIAKANTKLDMAVSERDELLDQLEHEDWY